MYAIRSYYEWGGVMDWFTETRRRLMLNQVLPDFSLYRITSYNVCYTKLLRPVYNKYNNALMIKLQATLGASVDYIEYKAEFIIYIKALGIEPKQLVVIPSANTSISPTINRNFNVGDIVIVNGYAYYTSYGTLPKTRLLVNEKFTVTYTNYKSGA